MIWLPTKQHSTKSSQLLALPSGTHSSEIRPAVAKEWAYNAVLFYNLIKIDLFRRGLAGSRAPPGVLQEGRYINV
jgi:hypothetical protein